MFTLVVSLFHGYFVKVIQLIRHVVAFVLIIIKILHLLASHDLFEVFFKLTVATALYFLRIHNLTVGRDGAFSCRFELLVFRLW